MDAARKFRNSLIVAAALVGIAACGADMDDLDQYVNEVKSRPGGRIEPLPEVKLYEVFPYVFGFVPVFGGVNFSSDFLIPGGVPGVTPETSDVSRGAFVVCWVGAAGRP